MFKPVPTRVDYVQLEHDVQGFWDGNASMAKYLKRKMVDDQKKFAKLSSNSVVTK